MNHRITIVFRSSLIAALVAFGSASCGGSETESTSVTADQDSTEPAAQSAPAETGSGDKQVEPQQDEGSGGSAATGSEEGATPKAGDSAEPATGVSSEPQGEEPVEFDPDAQTGLLDQELAILGGDHDDIVAQVSKHGGTLTVEVEATGTYQASFPVETLDELLEIRKAMEAEGFTVALVTTIEQP